MRDTVAYSMKQSIYSENECSYSDLGLVNKPVTNSKCHLKRVTRKTKAFYNWNTANTFTIRECKNAGK